MRRLLLLLLFSLLATGVALAASRATVAVRATSLGRVLAAPNGHTLYVYKADTGRTSTCYAQCAAFWPPLLTSGRPAAGAGVRPSLLGTTKRKDGKLQVTYAGHPLYTFAGDAKAGQVKGEEFRQAWWAVSPAGTRVLPKAPAAPPPTTATAPTSTTPNPYGP